VIRDDHVLDGDQVLVGDLAVVGNDLGAPVVAVLLDDLGELVADDRALPLRLVQNVLQVGDDHFQLGQLVDDLLALQAASRRSCMSRMACAWMSSTSSSSIRPARATSTVADAGSAR